MESETIFKAFEASEEFQDNIWQTEEPRARPAADYGGETQEESLHKNSRQDPFVEELIGQIRDHKEKKASSISPPTCVTLRVSNAKQVTLEIESTEKLITHFEGILKKLDEMIDKVQQEKQSIRADVTQEAFYACQQIEQAHHLP